MKQRLYSTSHFASKAGVTARTLRYYDRVGLLTPAASTEAGYRLYSESDFARLQQILALKFLGFSLKEIENCLAAGPHRLKDALALQKRVLEESRNRLDRIITTLAYAEQKLHNDEQDWEMMVELIRLFSANADFLQRYYTEEQHRQLAAWGNEWSVQDQQAIEGRWQQAQAELGRLTAGAADPAGEEAQVLAAEWHSLIVGFTHGDQEIAASLKQMYSEIAQLPEEQRPYRLPFDQEGQRFIGQALEIYRQRRGL